MRFFVIISMSMQKKQRDKNRYEYYNNHRMDEK